MKFISIIGMGFFFFILAIGVLIIYDRFLDYDSDAGVNKIISNTPVFSQSSGSSDPVGTDPGISGKTCKDDKTKCIKEVSLNYKSKKGEVFAFEGTYKMNFDRCEGSFHTLVDSEGYTVYFKSSLPRTFVVDEVYVVYGVVAEGFFNADLDRSRSCVLILEN